LLLKELAEVDAKDSQGKSGLHYACENGHKRVAKLLLEKGADLKAIDSEGKTVLHYACEGGRTTVVKLLLKELAEVDARDSQGKTSLHYACKVGHRRIAKLLWNKGARIDAKDSEGNTPLYYAYLNEHTEILEVAMSTLKYDNDNDQLKAFVKKSTERLDFEFRICKICEDSPRDHCIVPCGHTICGSCLERVNNSWPFCRKPVLKRVKLYF